MPMDDTGWERLQELFHAAADLPPGERLPFLQTATKGDPSLIEDVLAMIEEDSARSSLLDRDVAQVAGEMLAESDTSPGPSLDFGQYRILEVLGEGGMGIVYLAEREDLGNLVADRGLLGDIHGLAAKATGLR